LGGVLSPLDGVGPEKLGIEKLKHRLSKEKINEIILALNSTIDGQTTAHYIADELQDTQTQITSLARGVPIGGELDYLDDGTILAALTARKSF
jgi:recombination protein RecR